MRPFSGPEKLDRTGIIPAQLSRCQQMQPDFFEFSRTFMVFVLQEFRSFFVFLRERAV